MAIKATHTYFDADLQKTSGRTEDWADINTILGVAQFSLGLAGVSWFDIITLIPNHLIQIDVEDKPYCIITIHNSPDEESQ